MKKLKIWAGIVLLLGIGSYAVGIFTGELNQFNGLLFYGSSNYAIAILLFGLFCLLLGISLLLVIHAIKAEHQSLDDNSNQTQPFSK